MKIKYSTLILCAVLLWGCNKEPLDGLAPAKQHIETHGSAGVDVKISFAKVVAKAIANPAIRQLLVSKAELQFDKDYDVLYQQVKNEVIDGRSLDSYIKALSSESDYNAFSKSALLTIFVPHGHQAASTISQAPLVAVRNQDNKIIAYDAAGGRRELDEVVMPDFPVLVIKDNERVVCENTVQKELHKGRFIFESEGNRYFFSDNEFDGATLPKGKQVSQGRVVPTVFIDSEVQTAYNNGLTCNNCPHRDWIYYGIYPPGGINQGSFNIKYSEAVTSVLFENINTFSTLGGWDEGNYELYVNIFFSGASSTGVFSSVLKVISLNPNDVFFINDQNQVVATLDYALPNPYTIVGWDMQQYGNRWGFKVEEYDQEVKRTSTFNNSSTYGSNYKVDVSGSLAKVVKVGVEFGATSTIQSSTNFVYETTDANDILGGAILTWTDAVMLGTYKGWFGIQNTRLNTISTGIVRIGIEPIRVSP